MKIFPRQISIESGKEEYELNIRNSAADDRALLFKIRRSEHKIVEFSPKAGYVIAGQTLKISLKQVPHSMDKSRLLVKLVVLKRSLLNEDFEQSWTIASKRNGEVKKVIDIVDYTMQSSPPEKWNPSYKVQQGLDLNNMLDRIPSHDSDGVSEISMQQSAFSTAFYPPTPSLCSPDQVDSHKTNKLNLSSIDHAQFQERNVEEESVADAVAGSMIEFDHYSLMGHSEAHLPEEDSVELQSVSPSLSEKALKSEDRLRSNKPIENTHVGTGVAGAVTGIVDLNHDQQAMMAMLMKLAQSPATSTLLSQLLLAQQLQSAAMISPALPMSAISTFVPPAPVPAAVKRSVAPTNHQTVPDAFYYDTHPLSHAELARRYIYAAENEAFPSIRLPQFQGIGDHDEGKNGDNLPVAINPDTCSRLTVIPSSVLNRQLRDEFSDSASVNSSHNSAIPSNSAPGGRENCLLELSGPHVTNNVLVQMAELRLEEATQEKRKVIAIEVMEADITSLQASIGQVFAPCADCSDSDAASQAALQTQLNALRATVLEDNLKHLTINGCSQLSQLDTSVNRFRCLTTLNLSGNRLRSLSGPLELPLLRSIDLSHNLLTSLDFLQLLTGLSSLNASSNRIASLGLSINMLVAHSKCLATLDLSNNPVCDDPHYAQEVIYVLPRLRYFDSLDLEAANQAYSHSHTHRAASAGGSASVNATPQRSNSVSRQRGLKTDRRLPDLPDEVRSVRSGNSVSGTGAKLSYAERRRDFERRVQIALGQRRKLAAASPNLRRYASESTEYSPPGQASRSQQQPRNLRPKTTISTNKGVRSSVGKGRGNVDRYSAAAFSDEECVEDDQDAEMRSVQDSIQQLDSSMRSRGGAQAHSNYVPTSMTQAHQMESHAGARHQHRPLDSQNPRVSDVGGADAGQNCATVGAPVEGAETEVGYLAHTASFCNKRRLSAPSLIQHWAGHHTSTATSGVGPSSLLEVPMLDANSTLLDPTESIRNRATFYGTISRSQRFPNHPVNASRSRLYSSFSLGESYRGASAGRHSPRHRHADKEKGNDESRGYFSEGELSMTRRSSVRRDATVVPHTEQDFMEMQESERYGAWHPRYRVPKPIYGFSKPFAHRHAPSLKDHAPLFDTTVQRLRDSFRKDPGRGTFSRAGKGLPGEWYPMDYSDVEAIRRQGYFHETIGEVAKDSYRDTLSAQQAQLKATHTSVNVSTRGGGDNASKAAAELSLDPLNLTQNTHTSHTSHHTSNTHGTQASRGKFLQEALVSPKGSVSLSPQKGGRRQSWGPHMSRYDRATSTVHAYDDFSGFRKWHQGLFDEAKVEGAKGGSQQQSGERGLQQSFSADGMDRSAFSVGTHQSWQQKQQQQDFGHGEDDRASSLSSKYGPDSRPVAPLSVDSAAEMAAYFAEEEEALASHRREASAASQRVADTAVSETQDRGTFAPPEESYERNFATRQQHDRHQEREEPSSSSSRELPSLPLSVPLAQPTVSHSEPHIAQQLRSRLQSQTRSQMQDQKDLQPARKQETPTVTRSVTLLPMETMDSGDFSGYMQQQQNRQAHSPTNEYRHQRDSHLTSSSPIQMAPASPNLPYGQDGVEESFQAELRAFDLPSFPSMQQHQSSQDRDLEPHRLHLQEEAQRIHAAERSAEADGEVFVDIEHRIEAEEEALSNYLSWLENQHSGTTPLSSVSKPVVEPAASSSSSASTVPVSASSNHSHSSSGIPRYSGLSKSADTDSTGASQSKAKPKLRVSADQSIHSSSELKVFSPRDAAMRAEQAHVAETEDSILFGSEYKHNAANPLRKLFRA